ncbi:MAG: GNAT family N-acetyltransferase [Actinomycetota bacterium]|nr:GNAT family N-acetyltransferase [Actinomycetota bacterium]
MESETDRSVQVRRLRESDRDRWGLLWHGYLAFYRATLGDEVSEAAFAGLRDGERGMLGLVAVDAADAPIGLAHLVFHATTWSSAPKCYLQDLFVEPSHRGGEVARTLFAAIYDRAREQGAGCVYWHTQAFNGAARSLYDTVGQLTSFVTYEHELG